MILRQQTRRAEIEKNLAFNMESFEAPVNGFESDEINDIVNRTLEDLPLRAAAIFRMSRYEGKKYAEIASELKISVKTVEANMSKALALFRKNLENYINQ